MKHKNSIGRLGLFLFVFAALAGGSAQADLTIHKSDTAELNMFGNFQLFGLGEYVGDSVKKDGRIYLFMQQARLGFSGHRDDYRFYTELALGGENMTPGTANPAFTLLEMRFDAPSFWSDHDFLRVGQFKTPYGAEFLTPDSQRLFAENSIASLGANWGREIGLALASKNDRLNWAAGLFTGGGEDTPSLPVHALPENFGSPLTMFRIGFDDTGAGAFDHGQAGVFKIDRPQNALYLQGAYQLDTFIGHSTAMNIKAGQANMVYQQNVLLNSGWNPYLTKTDKGQLYSVGVNGLHRAIWGDRVLTGEVQVDTSGFSDRLGSLKMYTARIQGSLAKKPWEYAMRVAALLPDKHMGPSSANGLIGGAPFYEVTPSVTYYAKDWSKLIFEIQCLVQVPVAHEPGDGSYILAEMPSQTTYTSGTSTLPDTVTRDVVPEAKLMWQISF